MSRISTSSSGGNVNIQDTDGNPITATNGALNVNASGGSGFSTLSPGSPGQVTVGLMSTQLLAANNNRKYAHLFNNSGSPIFIQYSADAAVNTGIWIPNRTLYTLETTNLWLGSVNAIGVVGGQLIDILEGE